MLESSEITIVPVGVWYLLSVAFAAALFWIIRLSVIEQKKINEKLTDAVNELKTITKIHELRIKSLETK